MGAGEPAPRRPASSHGIHTSPPLTVRAVADSVEALADSLMDENPLDLWDDNGNGRITCAEARRHGIAPGPRDHPALRLHAGR